MSRRKQIEDAVRAKYPYAIRGLIEVGIEMAEWADANPVEACEKQLENSAYRGYSPSEIKNLQVQPNPFSNDSKRHDNKDGPCKCGAWHKPEDFI